NVDTDAIIPKQFLQKVTRTGFGAHLFNDWRFLDEKGQQPNPDIGVNLTSSQFAKDRDDVVARAFAAGVKGMLLTGTNIHESQQ
ncbi:hypothetical protein MJL33_34020, partial [Salmonella enterica subsp. enterica serovar Kentucky]|nr:hypothetical protein [Salmonella enterica subsp. enterica serovar Kentucky]